MISISYEYPETELYIDLAYLELLYCVVIYFAGWSYWSALFLWGWWDRLWWVGCSLQYSCIYILIYIYIVFYFDKVRVGGIMGMEK